MKLTAFLFVALLISASFADEAAGEEPEQENTAVKGATVGIDLGTTYSCVAAWSASKKSVEIIANDLGHRITPSWVAFNGEERLIGQAAKNQAANNPHGTFYDMKRLIGRRWDDPVVQREVKLLPFKVVNVNNKPHVEVEVKGDKKTFSPEEISAMVLVRMKEIAEAYIDKPVLNAVITVPAYFNDAQRQATQDAGRISGLNVLRIINEPTAAAIAYGLHEKQGEKTILVFDLGGGTFDVSVLTIDNGVFEVIATNGDNHLGGEDFDQRVVAHLLKQYKKKTGKDASKNVKSVQKLRRRVEDAKKNLSTQKSVTIEIDAFFDGEDFSWKLTRAKFEELNVELFKRTLEPVRKVLADAKMKKNEINEVVLVGGSTRIPKVQQLLRDFFDGKEPSRGINPDEAVAHGAAVQACVIAGCSGVDDVVVLDVIPLTLGIETVGGVMTPLITRNSMVPAKKTKTFSTAQDNQETVSIQVYEGERAMTKDCHLLGKFDLSGIPPMPRGQPQIEVSFEVDVNSILSCSARETSSGSSEQITINREDARSSEEIERMIKEAEEMAESDKLLREKVEAKNGLEAYAFQVKNSINDKEKIGKDISDSDKEKLTKAVEDALEWLEENGSTASTEEINEQKKELEEVVNPVFAEIYKKNGGGPGGPAGEADDEMPDMDDL